MKTRILSTAVALVVMAGHVSAEVIKTLTMNTPISNTEVQLIIEKFVGTGNVPTNVMYLFTLNTASPTHSINSIDAGLSTDGNMQEVDLSAFGQDSNFSNGNGIMGFLGANPNDDTQFPFPKPGLTVIGDVDPGAGTMQVSTAWENAEKFKNRAIAQVVVDAEAVVNFNIVGVMIEDASNLVNSLDLYQFSGDNVVDNGGGDDPNVTAVGTGVLGSSFDANTNTLTIDMVDDNGLFVDSFFDIFVENFAVDSFFDIFVEINITRQDPTQDDRPATGATVVIDGASADPGSAGGTQYRNVDIFSDSNSLRLYGDDENDHIGNGGTTTIGFSLSGETNSEGGAAGSVALGVTLVPTPAAFLPGLAMLGLVAMRRRK